MKRKILIRPERLRHIPGQFSWIDQRLFLQRRLAGCSSHCWALYLFLTMAGDSRGISYYSDPKAADLLAVEPLELAQARDELIKADLIAYQKPYYQVLSIDESALPPEKEPRCAQSQSAGEILGAVMERIAAQRKDKSNPPRARHR